MTPTDFLQLANAGIIPVLLYLVWDDRRVIARLQADISAMNARLLQMLENHADLVERLDHDGG